MALSSASLSARQGAGGARSVSTPPVSTTGRSPAGRRPARRWLTAGMLFLAAALAVAYVANAIAVNNLVTSIASLEKEREAVHNENQRLRGELLRTVSVERVTAQAGTELGLVSPQRPPIALSPVRARSAAAPNQSGTGRESASGR